MEYSLLIESIAASAFKAFIELLYRETIAA
jgi:hypothetical protein